jgi:hypothetical protein
MGGREDWFLIGYSGNDRGETLYSNRVFEIPEMTFLDPFHPIPIEGRSIYVPSPLASRATAFARSKLFSLNQYEGSRYDEIELLLIWVKEGDRITCSVHINPQFEVQEEMPDRWPPRNADSSYVEVTADYYLAEGLLKLWRWQFGDDLPPEDRRPVWQEWQKPDKKATGSLFEFDDD